MPITIKGKNISKKIQSIIDELDGLDKEIAQVAQKGLETAKQTLSEKVTDNKFTQKYGILLVNEIGLIETAKNQYQIVAPMSNDPELAYQMYFAEYGAGIGAYEDSERFLRPTSGYVATRVNKDGYWWYYDLTVKVKRTNTSIAVGYMKSARKLMTKEMKNLSKRLKTKIHTRIKRN